MLWRSKKALRFYRWTIKYIYQIKKHKYNKLTTDAITQTQKKIPETISNKANADGKKVIENKEVVNWFFVNGRNSRFITLKDHKPIFFKQPQSSLTKPSQNRNR